MSEDAKPLPQSFYDALQKGADAAKNLEPLRSDLLARIERIQRERDRFGKDPEYRKRFFSFLELLGEAMNKRDRQIAELKGQPQSFLVSTTFVHKTYERYALDRLVNTHACQEITYTGQATLVLRPMYLRVYSEHTKNSSWLWIWIDPNGWIMRDYQFLKYLRNTVLIAR